MIARKALCSWVARVHSQGSPHIKRMLRRSLSDLPPKQSPRITSDGVFWGRFCQRKGGRGVCVPSPQGRVAALQRVQQAWEHLSTPPWGPEGVFCGKATETLLTLRSKLSGRGPCSSKMPQNMKLAMRFGHSVWSKMGNYGTTYPQMEKKKWVHKKRQHHDKERWPPKVLLTLSEDPG